MPRPRFCFAWTVVSLLGLAATSCFRCAEEPGSTASPSPAASDEAAAGGETGSEPPSADPSETAPALPVPADELAPTAKPQLHRDLLSGRNARYGPADGGGRARLLDSTPVRAGELGRWRMEFTVGPHGIAEGGTVFFQTSPFWGWSDPQTEIPERPGYTVVTQDIDGARLVPRSLPGANQLLLSVEGGALPAGTTFTLEYGAAPGGARCDLYAEAKEFFYFWVDGDGDGTRKLIAEDLVVSIAPRQAAQLILTLPTTREPGEELELLIAAVDRMGNAAVEFEGSITLRAPAELGLPEQVEFTAEHRGSRRLEGAAGAQGIHTVVAIQEGREFESNPLVVTPGIPKVYWADFHGHSTYSDGSATPEDYFRYGRDVAGLDVCVLTDHDHHGIRKLDQEPQLWARLCQVAEELHAPERFVTLAGYEWTSWLYGHRHVLYFGPEAPLFSSLAEESDTPSELWRALADRQALTMAHHSASGATVATDWRFAPPPEIEPVVEIVSVHGNSEGPGCPGSVRGMVEAGSVRAALERGYRLGFVGSGDSHDGHPGLAHLAGPSGGLAALRAPSLTRDGIHQALHERRSYATNGPRIFLSFRCRATPMGGVHALEADGASFAVFAIGTTAIRHVDMIKNGQPLVRVPGSEKRQLAFDWQDPDAASGDWYYVRVEQEESGMAWASPIWIE